MATILVVDDDAIGQRMLGYTLQKNGHQVVQAYNGRIALQRLAEQSFDLIITDLAMPEMDGPTLLQNVRADARFADVPVIMLTASGHDQDRLAARAAGVTDFLTKPASSRELMETVNKALRL
jgi:CheY-like chemotaxis protein